MTKEKLRKIYLLIIALFVALVTSFYFIVGDQLRYTEAKEKVKMLDADSITEEINENNRITQTFKSTVDRINQFEFVFTKGYQEGSGKVTIVILENNDILAKLTMNIKDVPEQHRVYIVPDNLIDDAYGKELTIKIYSSAEEGDGLCAMMNSTPKDSSIELFNNVKNKAKTVNGTLCFAVVGSSKISLAPYYWLIMGGVGLAIAIVLFISYRNFGKGKQDYLVIGMNAIKRYKFLISQLVSRDFKTKYKRSVFGIFWSFLNPLLTMLVQFIVFSTFFKADTQNYPVYLISGVVCFSFFSECTQMCLISISSNYRLITKVYIPKYIFPLAKTISSSVNLAISLVPLLLVTIITGTALHMSFLLMFFFLLCLIIFSLGVGMILATLMVFFRDIQFIWSVVLTIWQYATPIFYPAEIIPDKFRFIVQFNPLYHFIGCARKCLIDGVSPEPIQYIYCLIFAFGALAIGSYIFKKCQDKFTLYL